MTQERTFPLEMSEDEYDELASPFILIPPGASGREEEGDSIILAVEAGLADWKNPGISLQVLLTVTEDGANKGKTIYWYPGVSKGAMGITKRALQAFGIEDKAIKRVEGKVHINPMGFAGAEARARLVRERSNQGNLRTVLDSTTFYPIDEVSESGESLGI